MNERFADAVVVAAGTSQRMGGIDKLEADLAGRPLLAWSVAAMAAARSVRRVIVVAAGDRLEGLARQPWLTSSGATLVAGGGARSDSVLAGVRTSDAEVVLIHDGARPLASPALADAVAAAAAQHGAAVPVVAVADSLKATADGLIGGAVERDGLAAAQTPQGARRELLLEAFAARPGQSFTDEAGLLQAHGVTVVAVAGEVANLKVTRPDDLELVRAIAAGRAGAVRTGFGQDSHQFGRADGLWLGGMLFEHAPRLHGHSDGDCALHALTTALLSAIGAGDIGRLYPAGIAATAGLASADMLGRRHLPPGRSGLATGIGRRLHRRGPPTTWRRQAGQMRAGHRRPAGRRCRGGVGDRLDRQPVGRRGQGPGDQRDRTRNRGASVSLRLTNTLGGLVEEFSPLRRRSRPDVQLRTDGLRLDPHRQLPLVPLRRPAAPLPRVVGPQGDVGDEHHRRRRPDHQEPRRGRRHARRADGAAHRAFQGRPGHRCA